MCRKSNLVVFFYLFCSCTCAMKSVVFLLATVLPDHGLAFKCSTSLFRHTHTHTHTYTHTHIHTHTHTHNIVIRKTYRNADKSLARPTFLSIVFSVQGTGGSPTGADPENRVGDQDIGSPDRPIIFGLQVPGEPFPSWSG
jgi:hypothetical protein